MYPGLVKKVESEGDSLIVKIAAAQCPNLKSALKAVIKDSTRQLDLDDADENAMPNRKGVCHSS